LFDFGSVFKMNTFFSLEWSLVLIKNVSFGLVWAMNCFGFLFCFCFLFLFCRNCITRYYETQFASQILSENDLYIIVKFA